MANSLGNYNPIFFAQNALDVLQVRMGLANRVYMGFDEERRASNQGDTIRIRRPTRFTAAAAPLGSATDLNPDSLTLTLNNWYETRFALRDDEFAFTQERIIRDHIGPAAASIAKQIDTSLVALTTGFGAVRKNATAPTITVADIAGVQKLLNDMKCPTDDVENMFWMLGSAEQEALLNNTTVASWANGGATALPTIQSGAIGQRYGFNFFLNQNRSTTVPTGGGVIGGTPFVNNASGYAKGTTTFNLDTAATSGTLKVGDAIKFANHDSYYYVTANATASSGAITGVTITPGLREAVVDNEAITVIQPASGTYVGTGLAFHRNSMALAFGTLPDFSQGITRVQSAEVATVSDPITGLSVRATMWYDASLKKFFVSLDALWGVLMLDGDMGCRFAFASA